jgi:predicted ribonuclease YlaK
MLRNAGKKRESMRLRIISLCLAIAIAGRMEAQQTDPTLTGAVVAQTEILKKIFKDREETQNKIIAAEAAVSVAMDRMHAVENKMLDYLSNAQGAMQNLYQIKRAAQLVGVEIPRNMSLVSKSVPGHLKGTAIALLVSDELTDAATQMASLYPFMKQLVTNGSYNVDGYDDNGNPKTEKHKVNLLNSAERYYVANEVVTKLENINTDLWLLAWQIRTMSWQDLWYGLDPEGWAAVMSGKAIVESLIYEWNYL